MDATAGNCDILCTWEDYPYCYLTVNCILHVAHEVNGRIKINGIQPPFTLLRIHIVYQCLQVPESVVATLPKLLLVRALFEFVRHTTTTRAELALLFK